jgi:DNA polymerase I
MNTEQTKMPSKSVVIIDGFNNYLTHFMVNEAVNTSGDSIGGVVGFLRSLKWIVDTIKPAQVYVVWEQGGPSQRRRALYPGYKSGRGKLVGHTDGADPRGDKENNIKQLLILTELLKSLPVYQVYIPGTECDDVIAHMVKTSFYQDRDCIKYVVSGDKDFYQLLEDPTVRIYNYREKAFVDAPKVLEKYNVSARNITLARAVVGDSSDTLDGVPLVGLATVVQSFPELSSETTDYDLTWLKTTAEGLLANKPKSKKLKSLVENMDIVKRNWRLMYLGSSSLSPEQQQKLTTKLEETRPTLNYLQFCKGLLRNGIRITTDLEEIPAKLKYLNRS